MTTRIASALLIAGLSASSLAARQSSPDVPELLRLGDEYLRTFVANFTGVVAEERAVQTQVSPRRRRELVSEFLLVQDPGSPDWMSFRDVLEVDGSRVRDRSERLTRLFIEPRGDALRQAAAIRDDGARYNLPGIGSLNDPLLALTFVQARYQDRFQWTLIGRAPDAADGIWVLMFEEMSAPTIVSWANRDLAAKGFVWVDARTGRISKTELVFRVGGWLTPQEVRERGLRSSAPALAVQGLDYIVTTFRYDERFQIEVPVEMRERHTYGTGDINAITTYGQFRRFRVQTEETIR